MVMTEVRQLLPLTMEQLKPVAINFTDGKITPDPPKVRVSIKDEDHVFWTVYGDATLVSINFEESPFAGLISFHSTNKHASSTVVTDLKHQHKKFKYTVTVADKAGKKFELDPQVEVMP